MKWSLIIVSILSIVTLSNILMAQSWQEYDPNTETSIRGKIVEILQRPNGPVVLGVLRGDKLYHVITAPQWYFEQQRIEFKLGDDIVVHGSKYFSNRGELFLIARLIHNISNGRIYTFREESDMKPQWRGKGKKGKKHDY